ncbi:hypothetical protein HJB89_10815 [Rhizobium sp. NZLR8]|uniref:hypothetical protein n=1 Tax=Rhizobium sp. NZLR8 TaxID=2731104 RepID=UPI001C8289F8|nr:hypothetical protein [Rhizobium sp. NZLR8]MBX5157616.1 hypothetical protein [Rhizobium sp. NZLR8]
MHEVSVQAGQFRRYISPANMWLFEETARSPEGAWLWDALMDKEMIFALRDEAIDVYYFGRALYRIGFANGKVVPKTHVKYLIVNADYIKLRDGAFQYNKTHLQADYVRQASLKDMKSAAQAHIGDEGRGVYNAIYGDPWIVDVEVAFHSMPGDGAPEHAEMQIGSRRQDRIDVVRLLPAGDGFALEFWEAKHFSNPDLFSANILGQLKGYRRQLQTREGSLIEPYRNVCQFNSYLLRLKRELGAENVSADVEETFRSLGEGKTALSLITNPALFVFGFDDDQKEGRWKKRREEIIAELGTLNLRDIGNSRTGFLRGFKKIKGR